MSEQIEDKSFLADDLIEDGIERFSNSAKNILEELIDDAYLEGVLYSEREKIERQKCRGIGYTINKLSE